MDCPRCGTPNEPGDRFCSSCGAGLHASSAPQEQLSARERAGRLVGTTRKAQVVTTATALVFIAAIIAFIALKPNDDSIPRDAYTIAADRLCLSAKGEIVAVESGVGHRSGQIDTSDFARELVPVVATWRSQLKELATPNDRTEQAQQLEAALLNAEVQIGKLARIAAEGSRGEILTAARSADGASAAVEEAVSSLGLTHCAKATIGLSPNTR